MPNNLGLAEYTLAQISESTHAPNQLGVAAGNRPSWETPMTVRITDHADNVGAEQDDPDKMAIFTSKAFGQPWKKDSGVLVHKPVMAAADPVATPTDSDASVIFPNYDYSTFE